MTPREAGLVAAGAARRLRREHNGRMTEAWWTAALPNLKKPPKLAELMIDDMPARQQRTPQTWEQQLAIARQWHARVSARPARGRVRRASSARAADQGHEGGLDG